MSQQKNDLSNNHENEKDVLIEQLISIGIFKSGNSQLFELSLADLKKEYEQHYKNG